MKTFWNEASGILTNRWDEIWSLLVEHLYLSLISIAIAIAIAVPLGIFLTRHRKLADPVIGVASAVQTIPSLALLVFLVPFIGTGKPPAIVALTIYGLLPILRNTYLGILGVNRSTVEAGIGMGMTSRQVLWIVELPLALNVIMGGIRTASVLVVGVATMAGLIGAGGLGDLIFRGLQTYNTGLILAGAIPSAVIAIVIDQVLMRIEGRAKPGVKRRKIPKNVKIVLTAILAAIIIGAAVFGVYRARQASDKIVITGKNFTEQEILVHIYGKLIENRTNLNVDYKSFVSGTTPVFQGMTRGDYDLYVEYTGTGLVNILKEDATSTDPDKVYDRVKKQFKDKYGIVWLKPIGFNNTYSLTIRKNDAKKWKIKTISDLARKAPALNFSSEAEFLERKDGYPALKEAYGIQFKNTSTMDAGIMYTALKNRKTDVIDAFTTDGRIPAFHLYVLEDDKHVFPPYNAAPVIREEVLKKHPELKNVINLLAGKINNEKMQELNAKVDLQKKDYDDVAQEFLEQEGLLK
ncbi:glycine betaine ABC transporter substrate-binding protein [Heyndrickxia acidiproducens]|jgi:osmoprotectant transport system permease protein|uniref:glycine betaine ABC transporter substrate-binding protein n=1 Tax=Heyndrickxia acidiproducens TaxID=1121084 RepID=UPI0003642DB9|nr:glycine betaine ABC transporter substrate-binding protein [Heyndrickxia acidiproducens]